MKDCVDCTRRQEKREKKQRRLVRAIHRDGSLLFAGLVCFAALLLVVVMLLTVATIKLGRRTANHEPRTANVERRDD